MTATISSFPSNAGFNAPWRPFQQAVLDELPAHLADRRFHLVAAPGSGKTVLGLEIVRRLNAPTLVLCPTLAIRGQWVETFHQRFLPAGSPLPDWVSANLSAPKFLTVATYQALHCACRGEEEPLCEDSDDEQAETEGRPGEQTTAVVQALVDAGIRVLVVDEAHHLRASWWTSLQAVKEKLGEITIVALTATPPYDAPDAEMQRYLRLCGPVDVEVSIPEMVLEGNLCPHQDYVYLNAPTEEEAQALNAFHAQVAELIDAIARDNALADAVLEHPWLAQPDAHLEQILDDPAYFSAMLVFVSSTKLSVPLKLPAVLGLEHQQIPPLSPEWLEILLTRALFTDAGPYQSCSESLATIKAQLRRIGAIEQRQVVLRTNEHLERLMSGSVNKLQSIVEIARREADALGPKLRMLVLTDFIRQGELPASPYDVVPPKKLGAAPIFDALRREIAYDALLGNIRDAARGDLRDVKLGVLSGTLTIIPANALPALQARCRERGLPIAQVAITPTAFDSGYSFIAATGEVAHALVSVVTQLFEDGEITLLIGTHALLGEGWDAPCVNSLVLATTVRTYMLSNQMRGRALRRSARDPQKVANIWHLVCIDAGGNDPGNDYRKLTRRFKAFAGIGFQQDIITNGIARLGMGSLPFIGKRRQEINLTMHAASRDRETLAQRWQRILAAGGRARMVEIVKPRKTALPRTLVRREMVHAVSRQVAITGAVLAAIAGINSSALAQASNVGTFLIILFAASLLPLPGVLRMVSRWKRHSVPESSLREIGLALLETLVHIGAVSTPREKLEVVVEQADSDRLACHLSGGILREQRIFTDCLNELLGPVRNPRYLLASEPRWGGKRRNSYYPVPALIGAKKELAEDFADQWRKRVGNMRLVYTRNAEGRKTLLTARCQSFSLLPVEDAERYSCWE